MIRVRAALAATPLGRAIARWRLIRSLKAWSAEDEARARFYSGFVRAGDTVFDVGANLGNRTKVFLGLRAKVIAVEPQPHCQAVLRTAWRHETRLTVVPAALGPSIGEADLRLAEASTIASMSSEWIDAVRTSGRFAQFHWENTIHVPVTTLDALIAEHGNPAFVKIDVEGFELQVLKGLTRPVHALSFEFTPECVDTALACMDWLGTLGTPRFNYSEGESMKLTFEEWVEAKFMATFLLELRNEKTRFGDIYARFDGV
jgi:FkbM family methyltransferase